jgi:predicted nucleic acid-binding protein
MTLCDTGPLVSMWGRDDDNRTRCLALLPTLSTPLVTTWACFTEAMYLLGKHGGHASQDKLWAFLDSGALSLHINNEAERTRMRVLMRQYSDTPMDLADASLVAAAETLGQQRIFTLDGDFRIYRLHGHTAFTVVP